MAVPASLHTTSRRSFLVRHGFLAAGLLSWEAAASRAAEPVAGGAPLSPRSPDGAAAAGSSWPGFPFQDPALVAEMVGVSHGNVSRVRALLAEHPALAKAAHDGGYGDWESALGAASHVGNREIALLLLEHGARLDLFAATMLGMVEVVRAVLSAQPALASTLGPHGLSLLAHAEAGDHAEMIDYLKSVEGAAGVPAPAFSADEMGVYLGGYRGDRGVITVGQSKSGMTIKAETGFERRLVRVAGHAFHPVGAPNVRIAFTVRDSRAHRLEAVEGPWYVAASRE